MIRFKLFLGVLEVNDLMMKFMSHQEPKLTITGVKF